MRHGHTFRAVLLATSALVPLGLLPAYSNPQGGQVVGGSAAIATQGATTTITQTTDRAVINWNTFNIGSGETTRFVQPNSGSVALNRVTGGLGPSTIYGTLTANGNVFIVNPYGVLIGGSAVINTAGFLATTNDIKNSDFMAGRYNFTIPGRPDASVVNLGTITASNGGFAALVAPGVRNSGTIVANFGKVSLASGNGFALDFYGDSLITLGVSDSIAGQVKDVATGLTLTSLVQNEGTLKANGGKVELTAVSARQVVDSVINNSGVIEARSIGRREGMIVLGGATSKTKVAGAPTQTVKVSGTLNVSGKKKGGTVKVTGENIQLAGANIKATGGTAGGTVMIGGDTGGGHVSSEVASIAQAQLSGGPVPTADTVGVDAGSVIDVSATKSGNGGKAIIWSDLHTVFAGTVLAKGGAQSGNGGFVEVSGKQTLAYSGTVDTRAANGRFGTLLLDPYNLEISNSASSGMSGFNANANNSVLYVGDLVSALSSSNVIVTTGNGGSQAGDITVSAQIWWSSGSTLTLSAYRDIVVNSQGPTNTATINPLGSSSLVLRADNTGTGVGTLLLQNQPGYNRRIDATATTGTVTVYYNPSSYTSPTDFTVGDGRIYTSGPTQLTAYMLVNNATQLQNVGTNLSGNYALGRTVDMTGVTGFSPIGGGSSFTGQFDGLNNTISNLTFSSGASQIGLFSAIDAAGRVRDLNLSNVVVTSNATSQSHVGILAGDNAGQISGVHVIGGAVTGNQNNAIGCGGSYCGVGGLVGNNNGSISYSYSTAMVTGGRDNAAGGLVGKNNGSITQSYAAGPVLQNGLAGEAGGLVGWNQGGSISFSYALGSATNTSSGGRAGGLVALNDLSGSITQSYATGAVVGDQAGGLVAGLGFGGGIVTNSYWDIGTTGQSGSAAGAGLTTSQARTQSSYSGWDFTNTWYMVDGQTRPFLRSEYSTTITNAHQLQLMKLDLTAKYTLANDINLGSALAPVSGLYSGMWGAQGFSPVGSQSAALIGSLDGKGHTIDGLAMAPTSTSLNYIGLFGGIGSTGVVKNLNFTNANITANQTYNEGGTQYIGVLAGVNYGTVDSVTAQGTINGLAATELNVGGLVGRNGAFLSFAAPPQGLIQNSSANVAITTGNGLGCNMNVCAGSPNAVGGLVGKNPGTILNSYAEGNILVGSNTLAGGLVGINQTIGGTTGPQPLIQDSWASGNVTSTGVNVGLGGLVGYNWGSYNDLSSAMIKDSRATGNVTANAALTGTNCSFITSCDFSQLGGLVGFNQGWILGTVAANVVPGTPSQGSGTYATGNVSVGSGGSAGGLVGQSDGIISMALATGTVTGAAGLPGSGESGRSTTLGGFVGQNNGLIADSTATGNVGSAVADLQVGGFAGNSHGAITTSHATGNVVAGNNSSAGGFASDSAAPDNGSCFNCNFGVGYSIAGVVTDSTATGSVTVGTVSAAGGFVAFAGDITNSTASGNVTGGANSILGGFAAVVPTETLIGNSHASGNVAGTGANTWIGGFAGVNAGFISLSSSATGNVQATSGSVVGGLVGVNIGQITGASTIYYQTVSVSGTNNLVGGLVGANFGTIVSSDAHGNVTGGAGNTMGSLVGANGNIANVASGQVFGSTFPVGTIINSIGTGTVNGNSGPQVGSSSLAAMPPRPLILQQCTDDLCDIFNDPKLALIPPTTTPDLPNDVLATAIILSLLTTDNKTDQAAIGSALISLPSSDPAAAPGGGQGRTNANTASTNNGSTGVRTVSQTPGAQPPALPPPPLRPVSGPEGERFSSIPPITETRFAQNEVVLQMGLNVPLADVQRVARDLGLSIISQQSLNALGRNAFRFSVGNGRSVRDVIRALEANSIVAVAQPNYQYRLSQTAAPAGEHKGDPAQYMVEKLQLQEVHRMVSGKNVTIAVIDSEADKQHTELNGAISEQFNAVGEAEKAHSHGTAMVGAIASRDRLLGVAPGAKILAVRAFSESQQSAEGTTYNILKSIDWAVSQGARVINMSFAGPRDPSLERTLKRAYDQGVVLVAAAGNAGPKSPPLFPGADPSVIAVTATDATDRGFKMANQGPYVSVASPGVDVLAPAPQESYQMSTGTSIATAHVSGVVALMLERDPTLTPADVRKILESTATDLGPKGKDTQFGWGLVNPQKALQLVDERKRKLTEAQPAITTASR